MSGKKYDSKDKWTSALSGLYEEGSEIDMDAWIHSTLEIISKSRGKKFRRINLESLDRLEPELVAIQEMESEIGEMHRKLRLRFLKLHQKVLMAVDLSDGSELIIH